MTIKSIINRKNREIAILFGNGINRYQAEKDTLSWEQLLNDLANEFTTNIKALPGGVSMTEFYDILALNCATEKIQNYELQKRVRALLQVWKQGDHHRKIIKKAKLKKIPVLTTNFDLLMPDSQALKKFTINDAGFTHFYPWSTYFSEEELNTPIEGFGIWFINGGIFYPTSIRLGLAHYMGQVERARNLIYDSSSGLYKMKDDNKWRGELTWLDIIFSKSLLIIGLALEENEVFLRWLLIERAKYYQRFPEKKMEGWYVDLKNCPDSSKREGKKFFMKHLGFDFLEVDSYDDIYKTPWT